MRLRCVAFRHGRIRWNRNFGPCFSAISRAMEFDPEVAVIEGSKKIPVAWVLHRQRNVVADKRPANDRPLGSTAINRKQTLPGCNITTSSHDENYPPDKA